MFERYNIHAVQAIKHAQEEARRMGHNFVGIEQILLGLMAEKKGNAAKALTNCEINLKQTRQVVKQQIGYGKGFLVIEIPFTNLAEQVFTQSKEISFDLKHDFVGSGHLLLGILKIKENEILKILQNLNINPDQLMKNTLELMRIEPETNELKNILDEDIKMYFKHFARTLFFIVLTIFVPLIAIFILKIFA